MHARVPRASHRLLTAAGTMPPLLRCLCHLLCPQMLYEGDVVNEEAFLAWAGEKEHADEEERKYLELVRCGGRDAGDTQGRTGVRGRGRDKGVVDGGEGLGRRGVWAGEHSVSGTHSRFSCRHGRARKHHLVDRTYCCRQVHADV